MMKRRKQNHGISIPGTEEGKEFYKDNEWPDNLENILDFATPDTYGLCVSFSRGEIQAFV